jgi:para-aminobenzoate synthetase component 1
MKTMSPRFSVSSSFCYLESKRLPEMRIVPNMKKRWVKPTVIEIPLSVDELLRALLALPPHRRLSLLDSCGTRDTAARFLIAGVDPVEIIESRRSEMKIATRGENDERIVRGNVLDALDMRLAEYNVQYVLPENLPVAGACLATFSYELGNQLEDLRFNSALRPSDEPDVILAFYDTLVIHDYRSGITRIVGVGDAQRLDETYRALTEALASTVGNSKSPLPSVQSVISNLTRDEYLAAVGEIQEHIAAGDIYQANLTQQFSCTLSPETRPEDIFLRLRRDHPASFAAFIRRREDVVISASPERFLRVEAKGDKRHISAWPIKGTRPRGRNVEEDNKLRAELLTSEKDRAENIMIVDLLRNDLGRVCRYGSVEVTELCTFEEHPTLFHLVSKVRGVLRDGVTAGGLVRAAFPCGSITGAPKIRAMEIIAETEIDARGLSMGSIGYFSFDGSLDLNVAIRTMVIRDRVARFNVGGGIVADSHPSLEYDESLVKARALFNALGVEN